MPATGPDIGRPRSTRPDARRKEEQLLAAAHGLFAERGTRASLEEVARRAGVGIGTLYRHFPTREALVGALLNEGLEALAARAEQLLSAPSPRAALAEWLALFAQRSSTYRGLPESVMAMIEEEGSPLYASCHRMRGSGVALIERAQQAGAIRADIRPDDVLALVAAVAWVGEQRPDDPDRAERLLSLVLDALG